MFNLLARRQPEPLHAALVPMPLTASGYIAIYRWRMALLAIGIVLLTSGSIWLVLHYELLPPVILFAALLFAAIIWQPRLGLYVIFALVLLFEAGGPDDLMLPGKYLHYGLQSSFGVSGFILSPLELLLLLTFGSWLAAGIARRDVPFRAGRLIWPVLLFYLALIAGIARGVLGGGDPYVAFWEARALLYVLLCYLLTTNTIRTVRHVGILTRILLLATGAFAIEGAYRNIALASTSLKGVLEEMMYAHDTVIFLGTALLLVLALWVLRAPLWLRLLGTILAPIILYTMLATQRRAGYIALLVAFLAFSVVFLVTHRKAFFLIMVPILVGLSLYLPLFWNNTGLLGQPARAIRSLSEPDSRDASSNEYRRLEKINVVETIHSDPILGVGFGREFLFVIPLPSLSWWEFWHYEPHHNILWIWLKTGAHGFVLFWILVAAAIARSASIVRTSSSTEVRLFALLAIAGLIQTLVFCYVDLGLVDGRVTVFLGTILGTVGVLDQVQS